MVKSIDGVIFLVVFIILAKGFGVAIKFIKDLAYATLSIFGMLDQVTVAFKGDHVTTLIFVPILTFF